MNTFWCVYFKLHKKTLGQNWVSFLLTFTVQKLKLLSWHPLCDVLVQLAGCNLMQCNLLICMPTNALFSLPAFSLSIRAGLHNDFLRRIFSECKYRDMLNMIISLIMIKLRHVASFLRNAKPVLKLPLQSRLSSPCVTHKPSTAGSHVLLQHGGRPAGCSFFVDASHFERSDEQKKETKNICRIKAINSFHPKREVL